METMMYDLGSLIDFLLLAGLLAIAVTLVLWVVRGSDAPAGGLFGMRFDTWSPIVPEEVDPLPWKIELVGEGTVTSGRSTEAALAPEVAPEASVASTAETLLPDLQDAA
jgi:hypothetical protein